MARPSRFFKSFSRLIIPLVVLIVGTLAGSSVWLAYSIAHPEPTRYLIKPEQYGRLSARAAQISEETWTNRDGSASSAWLLKGLENAPAVVLLHRYGADRSHLLDIGVKINEATNFTILMPDLRGHGESAGGRNCSFGGCESEDILNAIEFLRGLRTPTQVALVGKDIGIYGIEAGSLTALAVAAKDPSVKALALDSVPADSNELLAQLVERRYPFLSAVTGRLAGLGTYLYFYDGCYRRESSCSTAKTLADRRVLLLGGLDAPVYRDSTLQVSKCFPPSTSVETKLDLSPSGMNILNVSLEQSAAYHQRLIDFFRDALAR